MFVDHVRLEVAGGRGGRGAISFRREAHVPRGGPDGGDGGAGGDVVLLADQRRSTLSDFRHKRRFRAPSGTAGAGRKRSGKSGGDLVLRVPVGTLVKAANGTALADLARAGDRFVVARGGKGGKGNARFATSTRRAPRIAEDGHEGEERSVTLELKLLADIGIIGMPNAGKSTLLAALTRARPKVAAYPFTTLVPNLGVALVGEREVVIADIPGLIEGAHIGAGLGDRFLRHVERTRVLIHVVDASAVDPVADIRTVDAELTAYGAGLASKPQVYALNKMDLADARAAEPALRAALPRPEAPTFAISAATREGCRDLLRGAAELLEEHPAERPAAPVERRISFRDSPKDWEVARDGDAYRVRSASLESLARGIDWESPEAVSYIQGVLARSGIESELRRLGARDGDTVKVGNVELEWREAPAPRSGGTQAKG
jgi:GTPase